MRRLASPRGSIMIHVLVATVIISILAAGMVSIVLMQYRLASRVAQGSTHRKLDEAVLARMISNWAQTGAGACTTLPAGAFGPAYTCAPATPPCTCTSSDANMPTITVSADIVNPLLVQPPIYRVQIVSPDTMY